MSDIVLKQVSRSQAVQRPTYIHVTWLGLLTSVSRLSLLHHSWYSVVPSVAITFGHEPDVRYCTRTGFTVTF